MVGLDASAPKLQPMANCSFLFRSGQTETIIEEGHGSKRTEVKSVLEKYGTNEHLQAGVMETGISFLFFFFTSYRHIKPTLQMLSHVVNGHESLESRT